MNRLCLVALIVAVSFAQAPREAAADRILYHNDLTNSSLGTDRMAEALAGLSGTHAVTIAASISDFTAAIASGEYDLGIIQTGNTGGGQDVAYAALRAHVDRGGAAIINATWSVLNAGFLDPFGVSTSGNVNFAEMNVTDPLLSAGITGPVALSVLPTIYNAGLSGPYAAASFIDVFGDPHPAIIGVAPRTFVNGFLSEGFADGSQGVRLFTNQINAVLASAVIPEPSSVVLLGLGGIGLAGLMWGRRGRGGTGDRA